MSIVPSYEIIYSRTAFVIQRLIAMPIAMPPRPPGPPGIGVYIPHTNFFINFHLPPNEYPVILYCMEWIKITVVAKELGMSHNGVVILIDRGDLEARKVIGLKRWTREVSSLSLRNYKILVLTGQRRNNRLRKKSEGTGHKLMDKGYVKVHMPLHPRAMSDGYVYEQWLIMEESLGRHLAKEETVHHKNRIRDDNRIENLQLYASKSEHMRLAHGELKDILKSLNKD